MSEATQRAATYLEGFIATDITGFAIKAYEEMHNAGLPLSKVLPVEQWTPAYAAGILSGLQAE